MTVPAVWWLALAIPWDFLSWHCLSIVLLERCRIQGRWWSIVGSCTSSTCSRICTFVGAWTLFLIIRNVLLMWYCILTRHRERLLLLDPACLRTDYSSSAWMLLAHSSVSLASWPIHIVRTGLGRRSLVRLLRLYGTTSSHCEDPMSWRTSHCLVGPLSLCGVAAGTNPSLWSCWELGSPCRSVVIHLAF